jgi:protein-tyrosine-phosphatase
MSATQTVLFVRLHGTGVSRMAAAYFNRAAPPGWRAVSAGVEPADTLSSTAASLLAGTGADEFLDHSPARWMADVPDAQRMIALRNPAIQYELAPAE